MRAFLAVASVVIAFAPASTHAQSCRCEVSDRHEAAYNILLNLTDAENADVELIHLPYGVPTSPTSNERLLHQDEYIIGYDDDLRVPTWVAYRLTADDLRWGRPRTRCFRRDPRLDEEEAAFCADYEEPIFDRGHMVPNADMVRDEAAMINTYIFSNMVPQHDRFNQVIWKRLEGYVRDWAVSKDTIFVITGAVFDRDSNGQRDDDATAERVDPRDRVAIPTHFYKIILHERPNGFIESMTFLLRHVDDTPTGAVPSDRFLNDHLTTIDEIEALTGIDFLVGLRSENPAKEAAVERFVAAEMWARN